MYKNLLLLPDGTELHSGVGTTNAIKNVKLTSLVNSGDELIIGSPCCDMIEVSLFTPGGNLALTAGEEIILYKASSSGARIRVGTFCVEAPQRPTANTMKLVGYDRVSKLDKDLTEWLKALNGWPYSVNEFAALVCEACGLVFVEAAGLPNEDFIINEWSKNNVTGRQIMRWLGEIVCRFVCATPEGEIRFGWYTDSGKTYAPAGSNYYFAGSLSYDNYQITPVEAVQLRLADSDAGALWPQVEDGTNAYIIPGNPILLSSVTEALQPYLDAIQAELEGVTYTPCEVSVPADPTLKAGDIITVTDANGKHLTVYVMTKTNSGQRDTITCTGSFRRDSSSAAYNKTESEKKAEAEAKQNRDQKLSQDAVFNALTNNGEVQGLFMKDGQVYINAQYILTDSFTGTGNGYLPPTYENVMTMLWSFSFPSQYPPKDFYDLNGDGVFNRDDVLLANDVYLGKVSLADCAGAYRTPVTVTIEPSNADATILIVGTNMWGSEVTVSIGTNGASIPIINGDCSVSGKLAIGGNAIIPSLATAVEETPKTLAWKDNGDGTYTLIGS